MKKIWIFLGIIAIMLLIGYLYKIGVINTDWRFASIILAALAGPFTFIEKHFKINLSGLINRKPKVSQIVDLQKELERREQIIRQEYEQKLKEKELKIQELQAKLMKLQEDLETLKLERTKISSEVQTMSLEEKRDEFINYFGD